MAGLPSPAAELSRSLARDAEAVCRQYLSRGRREGRYWTVGDVANTPGRSLYVRLHGPESGPGAAGKWTDAATGEHGDLLDLLRMNLDLSTLGAAMDEARGFLRLPRRERPVGERNRHERSRPAPQGSPEAARRLFASGRPVLGTQAERYLRARGLTLDLDPLWTLRFHPACWCRTGDGEPGEAWPALLAAVTDAQGNVQAVQRTWLDRVRAVKAPVPNPRRSLGHQLGNGVRFGPVADVVAVGEGLESVLSLRCVLPRLPLIAALSAAHLGALVLPAGLTRLYVARDGDPAGRLAAERLRERAQADGIEVRVLAPREGSDFNADLRALGPTALRVRLQGQLAPGDAERFAGVVSPERMAGNGRDGAVAAVAA